MVVQLTRIFAKGDANGREGRCEWSLRAMRTVVKGDANGREGRYEWSRRAMRMVAKGDANGRETRGKLAIRHPKGVIWQEK